MDKQSGLLAENHVAGFFHDHLVKPLQWLSSAAALLDPALLIILVGEPHYPWIALHDQITSSSC